MCFYLHKDLSHQDLLAFLEMGKGVERPSRQWSKSYHILVHYPPGVPLPPSQQTTPGILLPIVRSEPIVLPNP